LKAAVHHLPLEPFSLCGISTFISQIIEISCVVEEAAGCDKLAHSFTQQWESNQRRSDCTDHHAARSTYTVQIVLTVEVDGLIANRSLRNVRHPNMMWVEHFRQERTAADVHVGVFHRYHVRPCAHRHALVQRPLPGQSGYKPVTECLTILYSAARRNDRGDRDNRNAKPCKKLQSDHHRQHQHSNIQVLYRPDALPAAQSAVSKYWRGARFPTDDS